LQAMLLPQGHTIVVGFTGVIKIEGIGRSVPHDYHTGLKRLSISRYLLSIFTFNPLFKLQIHSR
jgi:hypothetical protein